MWNCKNSGERASGVRNHIVCAPRLFVRRNSGLSRAGARCRFVHHQWAPPQTRGHVKGVNGDVASGQHVIARTINKRSYTTPWQ